MIVTSLALLLVAGGFLIAGIAKSSVALLMVSLLVTLGASATLLMVVGAARRLAPAGGMAPAPTAVAPAGVVYVPVQVATMAGVAGANGHDGGAPVVGYDRMTAEQVGKLVASGALGVEQLTALREYESANANRRTVLAKLERALA